MNNGKLKKIKQTNEKKKQNEGSLPFHFFLSSFLFCKPF